LDLLGGHSNPIFQHWRGSVWNIVDGRRSSRCPNSIDLFLAKGSKVISRVTTSPVSSSDTSASVSWNVRHNLRVLPLLAAILSRQCKCVVLAGKYFGSYFVMGGERFDTNQQDVYLFGENDDLNFLGSKPVPVRIVLHVNS